MTHLKKKIIVALMVISNTIYGETLFEEAQNISSEESNRILNINGEFESSLFGWKKSDNTPYYRGIFTELSLKLNTKKNFIGTAFADLRFKAGLERGATAEFSPEIREAWIGITPSIFDIRIGRQIVSWGKADGINPTDNINPIDQLELTPDYDEMKKGNELVRVKTTLNPFSLELIWIPFFKADSLPLDTSLLPTGINFSLPDYPQKSPEKSGYALRLELSLPAFDGSISYFNGYEPQAGFNFKIDSSGLSLIPKAYRVHVPGADFSTNIKGFGLRGEIAAKIPYEKYEELTYIPNPTLQYIVGIDKSIRDWMILLQYYGIYTYDFSEILEPLPPTSTNPIAQLIYMQQIATFEIERLNRLFTFTTHRFSHSVIGTLQGALLNEILHLEGSAIYNFTTEEYTLHSKISYSIADEIALTIGGRYHRGPENSLYDLISDLLNQVYTVITISF
ncbi:MAG: hypothetical protein N2053_11920 [Chitinispirillaceae bacterium]|nr:hypothetical protein [Chitinispirillaceae bacterium]